MNDNDPDPEAEITRLRKALVVERTAARLSWPNSIRSTSGWGAPGGFHALANSLDFADFCGAVR
jgi:hypothetical protein